MRPAPLLAPLIVALLVWCAAEPARAGPPWPQPTEYRLRAESRVQLDRWQGARRQPVDRTDLTTRFALDAWRLLPETCQAPCALSLRVDLEAGAAIGPTDSEFALMPDGRRAVLDLYAAEVAATGLAGVVDARLGRVQRLGVLGFDAVDGLAIDFHGAPHLTLSAHGGLAVRRGWADFGPDVFDPDGGRLPDEPGYVFGAEARTRDLDAVDAAVGWRRVFDDAVQREEVGAAARADVIGPLELRADGAFDLIFLRLTDVGAAAALRWPSQRAELAWHRTQPTFSADTIWNAFATEPRDALRLSGAWMLAAWTLAADVEGSLLRDGDAAAETAGDAGLRVSRRLVVRARPAEVGAEGRAGGGYGGERHYADVFAHWPVGLVPGVDPLWLRARLGGVWFDDADRDHWDGLSGWALLAARWRSAAGIRLDAAVEAHAGGALPFRLRAVGGVAFEDWW